MGTTLRLRLTVPASAEQVRRLCALLGEQLSAGTVRAVVCRVDGEPCDLATVDAVARLALVARRSDVAFVLDGPGVELSSLLALVGLRGAVAGRPDPP